MSRLINNTHDIIDSRDVIERIDELDSALRDACTTEIHDSSDDVPELTDQNFAEWLQTTVNDDNHEYQDDARELLALRALADEADGCADWKYGEALIRDSYFEQYARDMADDIGAIQKNATWPNNYIDWEAATEALQQDYTSVDFDGVTYWIRS